MTPETELLPCREAFERWFSNNYSFPKAIEKNYDGSYKYQSTYNNWRAWQAAWNTRPAPKAIEVEALKRELAEYCNEWNKPNDPSTHICSVVDYLNSRGLFGQVDQAAVDALKSENARLREHCAKIHNFYRHDLYREVEEAITRFSDKCNARDVLRPHQQEKTDE